MDPLSILGIGTAVSGIGGLVGSLFGNSAAEERAAEANRLTYQMFREGQAFNRQERLEAQAWNREMWYEQQKYNSPANQAMRYAAAGLNPANLMGSDAGNVNAVQTSPASSPGVPGVQVADYKPIFNMEMANNLMNSFSSMMMQKEQIKGMQIDNQTKEQRNIADLYKVRAETAKLLEDKNLTTDRRAEIVKNIDLLDKQIGIATIQQDRERLAYQFDDATFNDRAQSFIDQHEAAVLHNDAQRLANDIQRKYGMRLTEAQLGSIIVDIKKARSEMGLLSAQTGYTNRMAEHEIKKKAETIARTAGINAQNKHFGAVVRDIEDELHLQGDRSRYTLSKLRESGINLARGFDYLGSLRAPVLNSVFGR